MFFLFQLKTAVSQCVHKKCLGENPELLGLISYFLFPLHSKEILPEFLHF